MRPCRASRRVSKESGEVFVSSLHLHNLLPVQVSVQQNLSSCPAYSFLSCPSSCTQVPPYVSPAQRDTPAFPSLLNNYSPHTCEPQTQETASPTCCWWMKTLHASAPEASYRQEGDCNGIPTICMARLYRWASTQVWFLSLDGFRLRLVGSPLFQVEW